MTAKTTSYLQRAETFRQQATALEARYRRLSLVRLGVFIAAVLGAVFFWSLHWLAGLGFILLFAAVFYRFVRWHLRIQSEAAHRRRLSQVNEWEAEALTDLFPKQAPWLNGAEFVDPEHAYTLDLDIFGPYSYFHYVNRCGTTIGRQQLADWLRRRVPEAEILQRQEALSDLRERLDWRQHFAAYALVVKDHPGDIASLKAWLSEAPFVLPNRLLQLACWLMPFWISAGLALWIWVLPWPLAMLFLVPPLLILRRHQEAVDKTHRQTSRAETILEHYARLIGHIEAQDFDSPRLRLLHGRFQPGGQPASWHLRRLSYIISQLNVRYNPFAVFLNLFALWDLQWVWRLERWKEEHREALPAWFEALAEMEALSSLANAWYNNPDWSLPFVSVEKKLSAEALGHPLIHPSRRVSNDLQLPTRGHIKLITGSNMAGKSTFLRTAGLNIVLAMAGAPVCARRLELPPLDVFTSMRTQDALHESTSSFFAELKRLKFILESVEEEEQTAGEASVFFLLDEILKGTNSRDRHTGSRALIRQLIYSGGSGLIATHDLELGQLEQSYGGAIENLCMEVEIREGQLFFDYRLKPGVSRSFNATLLMKNMGIRIREEDDQGESAALS